MTLKVTFSDGTVANLPIHTTFKGNAWRGVVKNGLAVLTDKLVKANTIKPDVTIVGVIACGQS